MLQRSLRIAFLALTAIAVAEAAHADETSAPFAPVDTLPRAATPHLNFITLVVADFERAYQFYTTVIGMRERGRAMPSRENYEVVVGFDAQPLTPGISLTWRNGPPAVRGSGSASINLVVSDLAAILPRVVAAGGAVRTPLTEGVTAYAHYSLARVEDPDGNLLELVQYHRITARSGEIPLR